MPEYLWLGLILANLGRHEGLNKTTEILFDISKSNIALTGPKLSSILQLSIEEQEIVYNIILNHVDAKLIAPLTILYRNDEHQTFNKYFYVPELTFEYRLQVLSNSINLFSPHQSNEATDLRFLAICLHIFNKRIQISMDSRITTQALQEYSRTHHDDEKMRSYRPVIRSMEGITATDIDKKFSKKFWRDIGMMTPCKPMQFKFDLNSDDYESFVSNSKRLLEYIFLTNKEKSLLDEKFDVLIGSASYSLKILNEIATKSLGDCILGRHGTRTILEIYIILKYLIKKESEIPNIWADYKLYGISKYKLLLLKARESDSTNTSHFILPIVEALVNEIKWEEFIDIDLKYFDKLGIREKSVEVGEKELYDLLYDYDSNFSHGLWGAIRESSMLICDNSDHRYHTVPDFNLNQNLSDVKSDILMLTKKVLFLIVENYETPEALTKFLQ
ncbi:hypothetical protein LEP1GSC050_4162 [Leptospira broomii serovar Hurstbridge str. 5399]|uniref:Uncharacterized protein n=2 Tax=Leptospira broomii TaxID=301541 RepID=T0F4V2_9LEPT|nr:hypothetical protein LEP1GSC050_4162 [Leptospira broomii serovar Hurstbridge str. 5399]